MVNTVLSEKFEQMADIMEILGEDRFRINTYRRVARVLSDIGGDIEAMLNDGRLSETEGIGKSSLAKIEEFLRTGNITAHQELLAKIPPKLLDLLTIPGVGPKGVKIIYEQLDVKSIDELKAAIAAGSVAQLPGFGEKKVAGICKGIEFLEKFTGRIRIDCALEAAEVVSRFLGGLSGIKKIQTAGSLRRCAETIGDVDILAAGNDGEKIIEAFTTAKFVREVLASGQTKGSAIIQTESADVQVDVRVVPEKSFGAALQYFTGSKEHNVRLREIAVKAKLKLNEYGLFKGKNMIAGRFESEIYEKLGLDYIEPILREDRGEIDAARSHCLPELIRLNDIKSDFHIHTNASDGDSSISEIAEAAKQLGYKYICITDHSKSSAIANGLSAGKLAKQVEEIHKLNEKIKGITILAGTEVDILANGKIDFDDKLLCELDFVIASVHSGMVSPREKVTNRTLKAMDNPYVNCIAHPTGRLIGQREPMDIDIEAVIRHAVETQTALEVNANPWRLDLKDVHCKMAIEAGIKLAIGTDAHSTGGLGVISFGVVTAARGWATKADVLNTFSVSKLQKWVATKRKK